MTLPSERFAAAAVQHPLRALALGLFLLLLGAGLATTLELEASYTAMVPQDEPVVKESRGLVGTLESTQVLTLIVRGEEPSRTAFARRAADALRGNPLVVGVRFEDDTEAFERRWFASLPAGSQDELAEAVTRAARAEVRSRNPLFADVSDEPPWDPVEELVDELRERHDPELGIGAEAVPTTPDGSGVLVTIRPRVSMLTPIGDFEGIVESFRTTVGEVEGDDGVDWELSGQMLVALDEYRLIQNDLANATALAFALVILLLVVTTRRWQTIPVVATPLIVGLAVTLGATALLLGRLNIVSAFMLPALLGLGVDYCIHLQSAYEAALREREPRAAMVAAIGEQWRPCGVASLTTAAGFLALLLCDFDGIREFGVIASVGVVAMYASCFLLLPPLATRLIRAPRSTATPKTPAGASRWLAPVGLVLALAVGGMPMAEFHNDFRELRGELPSDAQHHALMEENGGPFEPTLLGVASEADASTLAEIVRARREADTGPTAIGRVVSLTDFLPDSKPTKRPEMLSALERLSGGDDEPDELDVMLAWARGDAWTADALPPALSRTLRPDTETWLVAMFSTEELHSEDQFRRWREHIEAIRADAQAQDVTFTVADKWSIVARMVELIREAVVPMTAAAFVLVVLVLIATRRRGERRLAAGVAVAGGTLAAVGITGWFGVPFNIFNIVVLPAVFGIGVDNAVQMTDAVSSAVSSTSPDIMRRAAACALSSATTAIGFGAMLVAGHPGIASLGTMALIGIGATFTASTVALPAWLLLVRQRGER